MTKTLGSARAALFASALLPMLGCGGSPEGSAAASGDTLAAGGGLNLMAINRVTHNGGRVLPHRVLELDSGGTPTGQIADIISLNSLRGSVFVGNPILPTPALPAAPVLPNGRPGNHFFGIELSSSVDPETVFALPNSTGLTRAVSLTVRDAAGVEQPLAARVLVGGVTAVDTPQGPALQQWLTFDESSGLTVARVPEAQGFLRLSAERQRALLSPKSILVIADTDGDLTTLETFPSVGAVNLRLSTRLQNTLGKSLKEQAFVSTHVGADTVPPALALTTSGALDITPKNGASNVDPEAELTLRFTEPVQPAPLGAFIGRDEFSPSNFMSVQFGPPQQRADVPIALEPVSPFDLSQYRVVPGYAFPGLGPDGTVTPFNVIDLGFQLDQVADLAAISGTGSFASSFVTGFGAGLVNAPVIPEAVLAVRSLPGLGGDGLSIVDLNGFGASTGNPVSTPGFPAKGESRYPFNPNVFLQPGLLPPPGTTTVDGGSAGAFTLTLDSNLQDILSVTPSFASAEDVHVGHALDTTFRNAPPPFGCQSGGGNVCSLDGLKVISTMLAGNGSVQPDLPTQFGGLNPGYENMVSWAPHPNPPALSYPPVCVSPLIAAREPVSITEASTLNLLVPGDALGSAVTMTPPSGLLSFVQNSYFLGPEQGQVSPIECDTYMMRQQIGHFVYVADRAAGEVVVLNSNRMRVIERIGVGDIGSMAMSPNLDLLAVTNPVFGEVTLISINPSSFQFHRVVQRVPVGDSPSGVAWSPVNEDILVCNEGSGTVSIISASSRQVRRTVTVPAGQPFEVAVTPRETLFGLQRAVYYGYILSRNGEVSIFESGPDGINGWGFDDIIGTLPFEFKAPKAIQLNPVRGLTSVAIAHEGRINPVTGQAGNLGDGAISTVEITGGQTGTIPLVSGQTPQFRSITFDVVQSLSASTGSLSGIPTDLAFDEMWNLGALSGPSTVFSAGSPIPGNHKSNYRRDQLTITRSVTPRFLLAAVPDADAIDVISIQSAGALPFDVDIYAPGVQPIAASGVRTLATFWRQ